MLLWAALSILVWGAGSVFLILVLLLQLCVLLWQKSHPWDLQRCSTDLTGKTAIVTGANSGECSCHPESSLWSSAYNNSHREGREKHPLSTPWFLP